MNTDQETLNQSLNDLNEYLYQGYSLKTYYSQKYKKESKKKNFKVEKLQKEYEDDINKWLNFVAKYLHKKIEAYLYFHFVNPKSNALTNFHPLGKLEISLDKYLHALEEIIIRIEERRNLMLRQEIAEKEYQTDILYKITYSDHTRLVKLNNIVLTKTDFNSENDNCFQFIYKNPGRLIGIEELEQEVGGKLKKRLAHIIRDLGFTKELRIVFFPVVTKSKVMFVNPITKQYAYKNNLPPINFKKIGGQSKVK